MPELHFAKPCTYTAPNGEVRHFVPGRYPDVSSEIADNWFVKAHLVKDGEPVAAHSDAAPLTHEERVKVKAAIDAAEGRANSAEAERDAAVKRADALQEELDAERKAHGETRALLEDANASDSDGDAAADGAPAGPYTVARGHQGSFKVMKGEETVAESLKKADAQAKVAELNAQG